MSATKTLRLAKVLYVGEAVDEALKRFAKFATFRRDSDETHWIVDVQPKRSGAAAMRRLCGELSNYALGLTIRRGGGASA
ncbi:MAG: HxsD-like protein [Myxococcota bacterium]